MGSCKMYFIPSALRSVVGHILDKVVLHVTIVTHYLVKEDGVLNFKIITRLCHQPSDFIMEG